MALIVCDECNKEFSDTLKACPHCGKKLAKEKNFTLENTKPISKKKGFLIVGIIVVLLLGMILIGGGSSYKKEAVNNCEYIISRLKDPNSFTLYSDIEIVSCYSYEDDILEHKYMFIDYGGANSYGGMVRSTAAFDEIGYIGHTDGNIDWSDSRAHDQFTMKAEYLIYKLKGTEKDPEETEGSYYKVETVDMDKVNKALGLD